MRLSRSNYHSIEANQEYMSVSQYKDFIGTYGLPGCEAMAMARLRGEWTEPPSTSMLVGSFIDAHFDGTLKAFKAAHPQIFRNDGDLRSVYQQATEIIALIASDKYFMEFLRGAKQVIVTADLFGVKWKIKIDSFFSGKAIVDLKIMKSLRESFYVKDGGIMSFVEYWGYDIQGAIYQKVVEVATDERLPFYIAAASKEPVPDHEILGFTAGELEHVLAMVESNVSRIIALKSGIEKPVRCGVCNYCRATKKLNSAIHVSDLLTKVR